MDDRRRRVFRIAFLGLAFGLAAMPAGVGRAHAVPHTIAGLIVDDSSPSPPPPLPWMFAIAASEAKPFTGAAIIGDDPVRIDCIVIENVGVSGHRVHFNGQGNSGQEYYGTIDDTESLDEVAVGLEPFDGPCDADTFFSEYFSGPGIVVAG